MSAISTALILFLCAIPVSSQYVARRRSTTWRIVVEVVVTVVVVLLLCCCCFVLLRRRRRRRNAINAGQPGTISTGKPLFGGPWRRQQPAPVNGPATMGYQGNVAVPPPAYGGQGGGYATNKPPV